MRLDGLKSSEVPGIEVAGLGPMHASRHPESSARASRATDRPAVTWPPPRHLIGTTISFRGTQEALVEQSQHDIVLLQETKWRFESTCEDSTHYFVHSGSSAKDNCQGGLPTVFRNA